MIPRRRVAGVDFSGARDAGNRIWIATGALAGDAVTIESCIRARDLAGGGIGRAAALAALVAFIAGEKETLFGLDFPFSLPAPLIAEATWEEFIAAFGRHYHGADEFRAACAAQTGGRELKRRTDGEARVPFAVYNLRLYRQTWAGIAEVLEPLLRADAARVVPMQDPVDGKPVIAEICPASLLKSRDLYPSYKGRSPAHRRARSAILRGLTGDHGLAPLPERIRRMVIADSGGDALDAVIAALGAAATARLPTPLRPVDALESIEGRVYF